MRARVAVLLFAAGLAWAGGNVGGVAAPLAEEFSISLTTVGLLSGTVRGSSARR